MFAIGASAAARTSSSSSTRGRDRGGFLFAEACCGKDGFDKGFRTLLTELFPAPASSLRALAESHPVWKSPHALNPKTHPLWGLELGGKTVLIYSPRDLSCEWNRRGRFPVRPEMTEAIKVGQNVVAHAIAGDAAAR